MGVLLPFGAIDDPLILNLVFTWTGLSFQAVGGPYPDVDYSGLTARSTSSSVVIESFSTLTTNNNGSATGFPIYTTGFVGVPAQSPVPEPATWAMMLLGFAGIGMAVRRRRSAIAQLA